MFGQPIPTICMVKSTAHQRRATNPGNQMLAQTRSSTRRSAEQDHLPRSTFSSSPEQPIAACPLEGDPSLRWSKHQTLYQSPMSGEGRAA